MASMATDTVGMVTVLEYITTNQVDMPEKSTKVLMNARIVATMTRLGVMSPDDAWTTLKGTWTHVENELCGEMGYFPRSKYNLYDKVDDMGRYISTQMPDGTIQYLKDRINALVVPELEKVDKTVMDLDKSLFDFMADWLIAEMEVDREPINL